MIEQRLPTPATSIEMFQHAAVMELRRLNDNLESLMAVLTPAQPEPTEEVALKEPKPRASHRDAKKADKEDK